TVIPRTFRIWERAAKGAASAGERRNRPATGGKESPPQPQQVGAEERWADNNERRLEAPHGGRGERGLWRLMSRREGCLPSGSEGPSSPQPMTPCRPPHLIDASSSSAKAACTRQRSSDVLRSGHGVLHFAVTYMCS
ncbi:Os12g0116200, partial [Oryza sativa Japonica Group]